MRSDGKKYQTSARLLGGQTTLVRIVEVDHELGLVTFKYKQKTHVWPVDRFYQAFPETFSETAP